MSVCIGGKTLLKHECDGSLVVFVPAMRLQR